jgi:hypothetical protein
MNRKVFTFTVTSRFNVFLDGQNYPVNKLNCSRDGIISVVSNGLLRGPGLYPIMFEAFKTGQAD